MHDWHHCALGESHPVLLTMKRLYARTLYMDSGASLDDLREAVATLEEIERTARRVLGSANPRVWMIEKSLEDARDALHARETSSAST